MVLGFAHKEASFLVQIVIRASLIKHILYVFSLATRGGHFKRRNTVYKSLWLITP